MAESPISRLRNRRDQLDRMETVAPLTPAERDSGLGRSEFDKGLRAGADQFSAGQLYDDAMELEQEGSPSYRNVLSNAYRMSLAPEREGRAPRVRSLRDVNNAGDAFDYASAAVGQGISSMAPTIGAALVGRGLGGRLGAAGGAGAASYDQVRNEALAQQYQDPVLRNTSVEDRDTAATGVGLAGAALESIVPVGVSRTLLRGPASGARSEALRSGVTEAATEAAQTEVGFQGERYLNPDAERDPYDYADALAAGGLTGTAVSAGASGINAGTRRSAELLADGAERLSRFEAPNMPKLGGGPRAPVDIETGQEESFSADPFDLYRPEPVDIADELVMGDADPSLRGRTPDETRENLRRADQRRANLTGGLVGQMANDPNMGLTAEEINELVSGDINDPAFQRRVGEIAQKTQSIRDIESVLEELGTNTPAPESSESQDRVVRNNLQNVDVKSMPDLVNTLATVLGQRAEQAPRIARQMAALSARIDSATLTPGQINTLARLDETLTGLDATGALQEALSRSLPNLAESIQNVQSIPSARADVRRSKGRSFLESMLTKPLSRSLVDGIARIVDDNAVAYNQLPEATRRELERGLVEAFGSPERVETVMDYYGELDRQRIDEEDTTAERSARSDEQLAEEMGVDLEEAGLTEGGNRGFDVVEQTQAPEYIFGRGQRPFRRFETTERSNEVRRSPAVQEALNRRGVDNSRTEVVDMNRYAEDTGASPEELVQRIRQYPEDVVRGLQNRSSLSEIDQNRLNEAKGELALIDQLLEDGGPQAVLEQYEAVRVESGFDRNDTVATDDDIRAMRTLLNRENKDKERTRKIRETRITFMDASGKEVPISAESIWKTMAAKTTPINGERQDKRMRRLFLEGVSQVLARGDITGIKGQEGDSLPRVRLSIDSEVWSRPEPNPKYREQVRAGLKAAEAKLSDLRTRVEELADEYAAADERALPSREENYALYDSRREEIKLSLEDAVGRLQRQLDEAMLERERSKEAVGKDRQTLELRRKREVAKKNPLINNVPAQAVARARLAIYRHGLDRINELDTVERMEETRAEPIAGEQEPDTGPVYGTQNPDLMYMGRDRYETGNSITDLLKRHTPTTQDMQRRIESLERALQKAKPGSRQAIIDQIQDLKAEIWLQENASAETDVREMAKRSATVRIQDSAQAAQLRAKGYREIAPDVWAPPERGTGGRNFGGETGSSSNPEPPKMLSAVALDALYNVAVEGNWGRLDTEQKKMAFDDMAATAKMQIERVPEAQRTERQKALYEALSNVARQSSMRPRRGRPRNWSDEEKQEIIDEIRRIRGEDVRVAFERFRDIGASGEFSMNVDQTDRLIRIAINAADMRQVAWHESLHDFFNMLGTSPEDRQLKRSLIEAASAPQVMYKMRQLLKDHPEALEQISQDPEERLAYAYQFWAAGELTLGLTGSGLFARVAQLIRELVGIVSQEQKLGLALAALHEGALVDTSIAADVINARGMTLGEKMDAVAPWVVRAHDAVFTAATDRLRKPGIEALDEIASLFHREAEFEEGNLPFLQRRFMREGQFENRFADIMRDTTAAQRKQALRNLQAMKDPRPGLEQNIADFLRDLRTYMVDSGVMNLNAQGQWVEMGNIERYFPRVFDRGAISSNRDEFRRLLIRDGVSADQADAIIKTLVSGDGRLELSENEHHLGFTPFAASVQNRQLTFIDESNAADYAKFQSQDLADIMTGYIKQAVHRAEYARDFGNAGERITEAFEEARRQGATEQELEQAARAVQALEGSIGHDMNPRIKELMSTVMTIQNVVLLPLALFSQFVDSVGLSFRTGQMKDMGAGYSRALKDLKRTVTRDQSYDYDRDLTEMLGIISEDNMLEAMGQVYGSMYMSRGARNVNRAFFRYNGMQGWNNSMRIAATVAGERFIMQHVDNARYMKELGIKPSDVKVMENGRLAITVDQLREAGVPRARAEEVHGRLSEAMFKFVDSAVLRPNAAHRAVWMSDPRFMLIAHLKQFAFSFQNVILRRATHEVDNENYKPMLMLAMYVPVALAADMAKWTLTGGMPNDWSFYDYFTHAVERSGIMGVGEFYDDAIDDAARGGIPGQSFVLGPSGEHAVTLAQWMAGDPTVDAGEVAERTIPGYRYFN